MSAYFTSRSAVLAAVGGLVAALSFSGIAQAITDTVFRYSAPKTGFYSIDKYALNPISTSSADGYLRELNSGLRTSTGEKDCFATGVNLPHGATLSGVRVWYKSGAGNPEFFFIVQTLTTGLVSAYEKGPLDSSGTLQGTNIPVDPLKIENNLKSYSLMACLEPNDFFYSARIAYTYDNAGD